MPGGRSRPTGVSKHLIKASVKLVAVKLHCPVRLKHWTCHRGRRIGTFIVSMKIVSAAARRLSFDRRHRKKVGAFLLGRSIKANTLSPLRETTTSEIPKSF